MDSEDIENDVIEIVPIGEYQADRAKLRSSLAWILQKAYGENVPPELKDPFYEKSNGDFQVKPNLINRMVSCDVYCLACATMFSETSQQWQGHSSIIQVLSRKGIYVLDKEDSAVTETILMQTAPFRVNAHLALIDSLMLAYASEIVSVERAVQAIRKITTFTASSELPSGTEDTVVFWMNKVCVAAMARQNKSTRLIDGNTNQKVEGESDVLPVITDLLKDVGDGCSLALVCSFYCPQLLCQDDVCLKESLGIADSLYNMRLVKNLCEKNLPTNFFHFKYEDLLYEQAGFRENLLAFLAELFYWFEIRKLTGMGEVENGQDVEGSNPVTGKSSVTKHQVPISNVTKRSFHKTDESRYTPELNKSNSQHVSQNRQVLLPKRQNGKPSEGETHRQTDTPQFARRPNSVSSPQERNVIKQSVLAWQDHDENSHRRSSVPVNQSQSSEASALLANVSIDSELSDSFGADQLRFSDLDTPRSPQPTMSDTGIILSERPRHMIQESHDMKLESITPGDQSRRSDLGPSEKPEPLMLAVLKPAKEKHLNHTKAQERDETPRKKSTSPTKPRKSRSPPVTTPHLSEEVFNQGDITVEATVSLNVDSSLVTSSSDEPVSVTPLPEDQISPRFIENEGSQDNEQKGYEAFFINPDVSVEVSLPALALQTDEVASSYTITDHVHTLESARAAGIPVLKSNETSPLRRATSRDDSMTSSRSSGDFSDHESHKIHYDHKARETSAAKVSPRAVVQAPPETTKPALVIINPPVIDANEKSKSLTTTFAEIKRIKDTYGNIDNSGLVYMQQGQDPRGNGTAPLKSAFLRKQADSSKKTSFAMLPNETTWQMTARQSHDAENENPPETEPPAWTELSAMRLKLDEKRKEIMRRKQRVEMQQTKARQRLGKAAFMRVMSHHIDPHADPDQQTSEDVNQTSSTSVSDKSRPFSREGIQETIDNIRKKWFRGDEFPGQASQPSNIFENVGTDAAVRSQADVTGVDEMSQSSSSASAQPMTDSASSLPSSEEAATFEGYDSSLDKLNQSFIELQGEISRLSLQQEQILSMQSPPGAPPVDPRLNPVARESPIDPRLHPVARESPIDPWLNQVARDSPVDPRLHSVARESPVDPRLHPGSKFPPRAGYPVPHQIALPPGVQTGEPYDPRILQGQGHTSKLPASPPVPSQTMGQTFVPPTRSVNPDQTFVPPPRSVNPDQTFVPPTKSVNPEQTFVPPTRSVNPEQTFVPPPRSGNPEQTQFSETFNVNNPSAGSDKRLSGSHNIGGHTFQTFDQQRFDAQNEALMTSGNLGQTQLAATFVNNVTQASQMPSAAAFIDNVAPVGQNVGGYMFQSLEQQQLSDSQVSLENDVVIDDGSHTSGGGNEGFFVSFGDENSMPKRSKPRLNKDKIRKNNSVQGNNVPTPETQSEVVSASPLEVQGTPTISVYKSPRAANDESPNSSGIGYVLDDSETPNKTSEEEMSSKKEKIKERQIRRKEEQERKKLEKLNESLEQRERQRLKQEETERKKAEEKARRKQIYDQYLLKRQQKEAMENGGAEYMDHGRGERTAKSKPRPKSMFVKAPPSDHEDSSSLSSQDDTSIRGLASPSSHLRYGSSRGNMRKAVSCNVLTQNGQPGGATYRRPPSPDLSQLGRRTPRNVDGVSEYIGPRLFVKPSSKSNRHIILNAVSHCCLAGIVNTDLKNKVLEELAKAEAKHFVILFRDGGCQYRAIYSYAPEIEEVIKICGVGPKQITNKMIHRFYKYNSGAKSFTEVTSTKHLSVSIDAVVLHNSLWKTGKPAPATTKKVY